MVPDRDVPSMVVHRRAKQTREVSGPQGYVQAKAPRSLPHLTGVPRTHPAEPGTLAAGGLHHQAKACAGDKRGPRPDSGRGCVFLTSARLQGWTPLLEGLTRQASSRSVTPHSPQRLQAGRRPSPRCPLQAANTQRQGARSALEQPSWIRADCP